MITIQLTSPSITIIGDPHSTPALPSLIHRAAAAGASAAILLGDIELRDSAWTRHRLAELDIAAEESNISVYLLLGNHDDYAIADRRRAETVNAEMPSAHSLTGHVRLLPHREVVIITLTTPSGVSRRVIAVPGAADFWPSAVEQWKIESTMPPELTAAFVIELDAQPIDVMLSHDAPTSLETPAVAKMRARSGRRIDARTRDEVRESAAIVDTYYSHAHPTLAIHGHFHVADDLTDPVTGNRLMSLNRAGQIGGAVLLDLETLSTTALR
ncbi:metallophosphoesterase [Paramicrobacterium agarici]|uniref:metallophosphoesterase n=1 Tax=Paramicrobacterium agarici TaxID=630514 RepID=UPI001153CB6E|nr:metallophosphoesterase [Microbacterium agarici]TQO24270.1 calcineurin-like phosphoesterase family protein [Microbacterium agarici]